ncbi:cytochrome P450 [Nocardioides mangrovicus]|uniref:Cytochrome P450 n=1 Tax=Nocardioides mangrovicus TaxID=2478913 RepID=A0A3L8NX73_9ACTN|nr:cytochrome P450 [Nocardioides mangrovicus]RLV47451.1 cytochrome P450 [Nocardioides mangrovicus]
MTENVADKSVEQLKQERHRDYEVYPQGTMQEVFDDLADRREKCPITFSEKGGFWLATSYDDISSILRRNNRGFVSFPNIPDGKVAFGQKAQIPIELDGPIHTQYRKLLDPLLSPARIAAIEDDIRAVANDLIDGFIETGQCDVVPQFAFPFPGINFLTLMGWPLEDAEKMNEWVEIFLKGVPGGTEEETLQARIRASQESRAYIQAIVDDRRANPRDDITTTIVQTEFDGEPISDSDLSDLFVLMLMAGLDTVQSVIAQSMAYLAEHQDRWEQMFASPDSLEPAIEELLRWTSPAMPTRNVAEETATVGDMTLPRGERVFCPLNAANRDPKYFEDPDEVKFDRVDPKPHVTFSLGAHRCVGVHLARTELKVAFQELHRRIPHFRLVEGEKPRELMALTWSVDNVKIAFDPAG